MTFARPPAGDDPLWPRASSWLATGAADPKLRVVGVPCSVGSISPSRADQTPAAVRAALARLSPLEPTTGTDLADLAVADEGDWSIAGLGLQEAIAAIGQHARDLDGGAVHAFLGGDNSITRPLARELAGGDLSTLGVLTLDAHHDVRHLDDGPRNGTPVRGLLADGLPGANVVQVGIGWFANSRPYADWCREHGIRWHTAERVHANGIDAVLDDALGALGHCDRLFVDVDMDVLDVAFAPACPGARPGGMTPDQLLRAVRRLGGDRRVVAADFVEVDATTDHDGRTVLVTAMALLAFAAGVASR